jgi:hypothetical protein
VATDGGYLTNEHKLPLHHGTPVQAAAERSPWSCRQGLSNTKRMLPRSIPKCSRIVP